MIHLLIIALVDIPLTAAAAGTLAWFVVRLATIE